MIMLFVKLINELRHRGIAHCSPLQISNKSLSDLHQADKMTIICLVNQEAKQPLVLSDI